MAKRFLSSRDMLTTPVVCTSPGSGFENAIGRIRGDFRMFSAPGVSMDPGSMPCVGAMRDAAFAIWPRASVSSPWLPRTRRRMAYTASKSMALSCQ